MNPWRKGEEGKKGDGEGGKVEAGEKERKEGREKEAGRRKAGREEGKRSREGRREGGIIFSFTSDPPTYTFLQVHTVPRDEHVFHFLLFPFPLVGRHMMVGARTAISDPDNMKGKLHFEDGKVTK